MVPRPGTTAVSTTAVDPDAEVDEVDVDDAVDEVVVVELLPTGELLQAAATMPAVTRARPTPVRRIPRRGLPLVLGVDVPTIITLPVWARLLHGRGNSLPRAINYGRAPRSDCRPNAAVPESLHLTPTDDRSAHG